MPRGKSGVYFLGRISCQCQGPRYSNYGRKWQLTAAPGRLVSDRSAVDVRWTDGDPCLAACRSPFLRVFSFVPCAPLVSLERTGRALHCASYYCTPPLYPETRAFGSVFVLVRSLWECRFVGSDSFHCGGAIWVWFRDDRLVPRW